MEPAKTCISERSRSSASTVSTIISVGLQSAADLNPQTDKSDPCFYTDRLLIRCLLASIIIESSGRNKTN